MSGPRIAVVGSGANGSSVAADLIRAGHDVVLIEQWPEHVEAMRRGGLRIEMPDETVTVDVRAHHLCEVCTFTGRFDVVFVLMKAYDTRWACQLVEPYLEPAGLIVGLQNGMTADVVADVAGAHRALGAVIEVASMMVDPGVVQRYTPPSRSWFALGGLDPSTSGRAEELAEVLRAAGTVEVVDDIRAAKWMKLVSNSTTLVTTAMLGLPMLDALQAPGMRELMVRSGQEALDVGAALGYRPLPIFGLTPRDMGATDRIVELLLDTLYAGFVLPGTTTTILHDWLKGRRSEAGDINGRVVAHAGLLPGGAPVNAAVLEIAHRVERRELRPGPAVGDLLAELAGAAVVDSVVE
ncbi:2-dehydropantoate 2-reductase [Dactylosporangium sp. AC04546]|uniref:ketopantoate reductase family protein n=1 Tax=Dactylosporangium sp. AC04546 TaxID=2862460 RepID=UPI001EDED369|nr:2-dehydropantoate 2-reductase [Dactylosporangium sp. AC04546]WVK79381.1 2-dehydropantoate 2-reductase [Dactylosporangium sp. AC04546]